MPVFLAAANALYEGNMVILNVYAEISEPRNFYCLSAMVLIIYTIVIGLCGYMGYFAYGVYSKSIILLNMPIHESLAIASRIMYIVAVMGSNVLLF